MSPGWLERTMGFHARRNRHHPCRRCQSKKGEGPLILFENFFGEGKQKYEYKYINITYIPFKQTNGLVHIGPKGRVYFVNMVV